MINCLRSVAVYKRAAQTEQETRQQINPLVHKGSTHLRGYLEVRQCFLSIGAENFSCSLLSKNLKSKHTEL